MSAFQTALGGGLILAAVTTVIQSITPPTHYMHVKSMDVAENGDVTAVRSIYRDVVADWRVTVVIGDADGPSCATRPGPEMHQGWSRYTPAPVAVETFDMDVWVGDPGCWERLVPGEYSMFVAWTPRDGTPTISATAEFTKQ